MADNSISFGQPASLKKLCGAPAPLVINGPIYAACMEDTGHFPKTPHKVVVYWNQTNLTVNNGL